MACLNDVLVSMTLNKLVMGHRDLLAGFPMVIFLLVIGWLTLNVRHVPMAPRGPKMIKPQAFWSKLALPWHVYCHQCPQPLLALTLATYTPGTLVLISEEAVI